MTRTKNDLFQRRFPRGIHIELAEFTEHVLSSQKVRGIRNPSSVEFTKNRGIHGKGVVEFTAKNATFSGVVWLASLAGL